MSDDDVRQILDEMRRSLEHPIGTGFLAPPTESQAVLRARIKRLAAERRGEAPDLRAAPAPAPDGPLKTWKAIAEACGGVSVDTLQRLRKAHKDKRRPWFASATEARAWFAGLQTPPPKPVRAPRPPKAAPPVSSEPLDFLAAVSRLTSDG